MINLSLIRKIVGGFGLAVVLAGCNVGMAPDAMSREEARDALGKLSPQEQIKYYQEGPMPAEQKKAKIAEIEAKYGVKAPAVGGPQTGPQ